TEGEHAGVNTRIKDAWEASWRQGKFSNGSGDGPSDTTVLAVAKTTANTPGHTIKVGRVSRG
ncbi:unnamed protein product, partial [Ascophyllum nodosum]